MGRSRSRRRRGKTGGQGSGGSGKGKGTGGSRGRSSSNRGGQGRSGSGKGKGTGGSRGRSNNTRGGQAKANRNQSLKARKTVSPTMNKVGAGFSLGADVYKNIVGNLIKGQPAQAIENASRIRNQLKSPSDWQVQMGLRNNLDYTDMKAGPTVNINVQKALKHLGVHDSWWGKRLPSFVKDINFNHTFYSPNKLKVGDDKYTNPGTTNRGGNDLLSGINSLKVKKLEDIYQAELGRASDEAGAKYWLDTHAQGDNVDWDNITRMIGSSAEGKKFDANKLKINR